MYRFVRLLSISVFYPIHIGIKRPWYNISIKYAFILEKEWQARLILTNAEMIRLQRLLKARKEPEGGIKNLLLIISPEMIPKREAKIGIHDVRSVKKGRGCCAT